MIPLFRARIKSGQNAGKNGEGERERERKRKSKNKRNAHFEELFERDLVPERIVLGLFLLTLEDKAWRQRVSVHARRSVRALPVHRVVVPTRSASGAIPSAEHDGSTHQNHPYFCDSTY